jgi:hypothetical protein
MPEHIITRQRLVSQQIAAPATTDPAEVVRYLGAVQAQEYRSAVWAVGLRTPGATRQSVEQAIAARKIVSTWPMRGTIHFMAPADVRWMLALLTPRIVQRSQARYRQLELDAATFAASGEVISQALVGDKQLTRPELYALLEANGIATTGQRGYHILSHHAQNRLICFAMRNGPQPSFALLDEWAPEGSVLPHAEALATLALRYFTSHGPATIHDFAWWSGLPMAEAKAGLAAIDTQLQSETIAGQSYFWGATTPTMVEREPIASLLPPFDEFLLGYRDRSAALDPQYMDKVVPGGNGVFNPIMVLDGRVVGTWRGSRKGDATGITFHPFEPENAEQPQQFAAAVAHYGRFMQAGD